MCAEPLQPALLVQTNADGRLTKSYEVLRCARCGTGYTEPIPSVKSLSRYYATGIYQKSGGRGSRVIDSILNLIGDLHLRQIARFHAPGKLLDAGCGKGRFLARAARQGWNTLGTDLSASQAAAARARYNMDVRVGELQDIRLDADSMDVITAWHVLEHLSAPNQLLDEAWRILKPNGLLVIEVPNWASWQSSLGLGDWMQLDVPRHLTHFTPAGIETLLSQHQFRVLALRTLSLQMGWFGMLQSILNRFGMPPNWLLQWLKRANTPVKNREVVVNLGAAALLALPALLLETISILFGAGSVIYVIAGVIGK